MVILSFARSCCMFNVVVRMSASAELDQDIVNHFTKSSGTVGLQLQRERARNSTFINTGVRPGDTIPPNLFADHL